RLDPCRWQERKRPVAIGGAEALKDAPAHALRACTLRAEEFSRVEILDNDGSHRSRFDAARADGGARLAHRRLIGGHEARRPRHSGQTRLRITTAAQIIIGAAVAAIDISLHVPRELTATDRTKIGIGLCARAVGRDAGDWIHEWLSRPASYCAVV